MKIRNSLFETSPVSLCAVITFQRYTSIAIYFLTDSHTLTQNAVIDKVLTHCHPKMVPLMIELRESQYFAAFRVHRVGEVGFQSAIKLRL